MDKVKEHMYVLPKRLVGLSGDSHPLKKKSELLAVFAVVDHNRN
jgi:hypothetical protein